jgi:hypothetical protein
VDEINEELEDAEFNILDIIANQEKQVSSFAFFLFCLELSDTQVYAPRIRALFGTASWFLMSEVPLYQERKTVRLYIRLRLFGGMAPLLPR